MITATTPLNTDFGTFFIRHHSDGHDTCLSISMGNLSLDKPIIRIHSACFFGEALRAQDCDCRQQLLSAMKKISKEGNGAIIYMFQEGRGIGIENKIRSLGNQAQHGVDTVESFNMLGFTLDGRDYTVAKVALVDLQVSKVIRLISNNPRKIKFLEECGYEVIKEQSMPYAVSVEASNYLKVKQKKLQHTIDFNKIHIK